MLDELTQLPDVDSEPPHRRPRLRSTLILGLIALMLAGAGVVAALMARKSPGHDASKRISAYLDDLRNERYSRAYDRLCAGGDESHFTFVTRQLREHSSGRGVASYSITIRRTVDSDSYNVGSGTVTLADGELRTVSFLLRPDASPPCIAIVDGLD